MDGSVIFFVGDEPGKKNVDPRVAFVGTASYKKLLGWIADMKLSTNDIVLMNKGDFKKYSWGGVYVETRTLQDGDYMIDIDKDYDKFIALGRNAEKRIKELGLECFYLPHPSGNNPTANKGKVLDRYLLECMKFISS